MFVSIKSDDRKHVLGVSLVNGAKAYESKKAGGVFGGISTTYPPLHEFLSEVDQDGWEVCDTLKFDAAGSYHGDELILKRQVS